VHKEHRRLRNGLDGGDRRDIQAYIGVKTGSFPLERPGHSAGPPLCAPPPPCPRWPRWPATVRTSTLAAISSVAPCVQMSVDAECGGLFEYRCVMVSGLQCRRWSGP
jgi:hypothetical protein